MPEIERLRAEIVACRVCVAHLPPEPRPTVQIGAGARLLIVSQAPGRYVHASGIPWDDASGARLRDWLGLDAARFHDPEAVALLPMGLCFPGRGAAGDLPPRRECAPLWHARVLACLTQRRLTLLVGQYAQAQYLPQARRLSLTERVKAFDQLAPQVLALPHPSWRATGWMRRNPWFAEEILPRLRNRVAAALAP